MKNNFEIGIIGGGPAGSTAASFLCDYGFDVCLFEKKSFPRETLCGEFLSTEVVHILKELKLFKDFILLHPNKINAFSFFNTSGRSISSKFEFGAYGISRSVLDNLLLCNARRKGVTIFQPAEVKEIIRSANSFNLFVETGNTKEYKIEVKNLIAAYGKQNILDSSLNRNFANYRSRLNGIKFHLNKKYLDHFQENEIQIYAADNIYCGVNEVDNSKVTFCFLEDRNSEQPPPRKQLKKLQEKNKAFGNLFSDHNINLFEDTPVYGAGNIYFGRKNIVEEGIFMIGDAAGVIAPLAGDGIGIAMESGKLIADLFHKNRSRKLQKDKLISSYRYQWNKLFNGRIRIAKIIQNVILSRYGRNTGFKLIELYPALLKYLIKSTRNISV